MKTPWADRALAITPLALTLVTLSLYWTGTTGAFLFDDWINLSPLKQVDGPGAPSHQLRDYLSRNRSGPTGRPVAMLSFLPHAGYWPHRAAPFLRTNVLLHCLNGLMLLTLVRRLVLCSTTSTERRANALALLAASVWLLHPIQVSTVLYAVQRMTQLAALFSLLAFLSYVRGRLDINAGHTTRGLVYLAFTPAFALIGFYAKEIAALVPLALLLIEYWLIPTDTASPRIRARVRILMLWAPLVLLLGVLTRPLINAAYSAAPFSAAERVLTEARVVTDYLWKLAVPKSVSAGLFHNASIEISEGLLSPPSTLVSVLLLGALIISGIALRRHTPLLAWGLTFFLAMHLLEGTTIPLELYYEHRNYLPSVGLAVTLASGIIALATHYRTAGITAAVGWLALSAVQTHVRADNWGHPLRAAEMWTHEYPESSRAWQNLALRHGERGNDRGVHYALRRWRSLQPNHMLPVLSELTYDCPTAPIPAQHRRRIRELVRHGNPDNGILNAFQRLTNQTLTGACRGLRPDQIHTLIRLLLDNPRLASDFVRQRLWHLDGRLLLAPGFKGEALKAFNKSQQVMKNDVLLTVQARTLVEYGYEAEAELLLNRYDGNGRRPLFGPIHVYWWLKEPDGPQQLLTRLRNDQIEPHAEGLHMPVMYGPSSGG